MEHNPRKNVFRSINRHGGRKQASVALQRVVNRDVFEARIQHSRVKEHEAEVPRGFARYLVGIACGAPLHKLTAAMTSSTRRPRRVLPTSSARSSVR